MFGTATTDIKDDFLKDLGLGAEYNAPALDLLVDGESRFIKDARVNLKNALASEHLSEKETALIALSIAINNKNEALRDYFTELAKIKGATAEEIGEMAAIASLLATNNVFYRFRHFMDKEEYNSKQAGIKMAIMARPKTDKEFFELVSLAVSAVNGCEMCVKSHEASLLKLESTEDRIFDAIKLSAVVAGIDRLVS